MSVLIPSRMASLPLVLPDSPFHHLTSLSRADLAATRDLPTADRRLLAEDFVGVFQWETVPPLLPLQLELPPEVPPWHARVCRSQYAWLPSDDIHCADDLIGLDNADGYIRMIWPCACSTSAPGAPFLASASPAPTARHHSIQSASAWSGCWHAGAIGPGRNCSPSCTLPNGVRVTVCGWALSSTTSLPSPPSASRSTTPPNPGSYNAKTACC
ncbi:MAG: hypothetical protein AB8I69_10955 [Anaerolineae bacterium]